MNRKVIADLIDDVRPLWHYVGVWILNAASTALVDAVAMFKSLLRGDAEQKLVSVVRFVLSTIRFQIQFILSTIAVLLNALASLINNLFSLVKERKLSREEVEYLLPVFGNAVDYSAVRIQTGGVKEFLGISPQAVGNDVFLRRHWGGLQFDENQLLTKAGYRVLGHELAHVWQYQTSGAGYIGDALLTQFFGVFIKRFNWQFSDGYNVETALKRAIHFNACNVEQQAVLAELIALAHQTEEPFCLAAFNRVSGFQLSHAEFEHVLNAHRELHNGELRACLQTI